MKKISPAQRVLRAVLEMLIEFPITRAHTHTHTNKQQNEEREVGKESRAAEAWDPSGGRPNIYQGSTSGSVPGTVLALANEEQF